MKWLVFNYLYMSYVSMWSLVYVVLFWFYWWLRRNCLSLPTTLWNCCYDIVTKTAVFIPDARPVFFVNMCGTAPSGLKQHAEVWCFNAMLLLLCLLCVMNVLWMCYESVIKVLSVMKVLWKCYESFMKVLWKCCESVMKVLWKCYECVMDVLWMHRDV